MTASQIKQVAIDHFNCINAGNLAAAAEHMTADCINHSARPEAQGRAGFVSILTKMRTAFPDLAFTLEDVVSEGDRAVLRVTVTGTQQGPLAFVQLPLAASGKAVKFEQIHIVRVADGKIVEHWHGQDCLAMFRQLGLQVTQ